MAMLRLVSDENIDGKIVRGLLHRQPNLDLVRVQDVGLSTAKDPAILAWAAQEQRIVLTHDLKTMPVLAGERVRLGQAMPGVFYVPNWLPTGQAIDAILLLALASFDGEWEGQVLY